MSETPDLSGLRIDRSKGRRRGRGGRWTGRVVLLAAVVAAVWLFQRPLRELVDRLRLPEVRSALVVRRSPAAAAGAEGASANGYVVARTRAALSAEEPGRIVAIHVVEGTRVKAGDVVARLDYAEQEARLGRARAEREVAAAAAARAQSEAERDEADLARRRVDVARAEATVAEREAELAFAIEDEERFEELVKSGVADERRGGEVRRDRRAAGARREGAVAELSSARAAVRTAEAVVAVARKAAAEADARVASAAAGVIEAEAALEKTYVRAPFDGVVVLKEAEVGEVVSPNSQGGSNARGSVATMVDFASLEVQAEVPETTLAAVREGAPARIYLDAFPGEPYTGRIDRIWPTADRQKATVEVRVAFDEPDGRLRPDMGVRVVFLDEGVEVEAADEEPVLLVPVEAVVRVGGRSGVFALERGHVRFQAIETGDTHGNRQVVLAGLTGDERVVLAPPAGLTDGDRVRIAAD